MTNTDNACAAVLNVLFITLTLIKSGGPHTVVANLLDCDIVISKFQLQSCYYIHFQTYLWERYQLPYPPGMN